MKLAVVVGKDGVPTQVRVTRSLFQRLDEQAVLCVRRWRFKPGIKDGQSVSVQIEVAVNFNHHELGVGTQVTAP